MATARSTIDLLKSKMFESYIQRPFYLPVKPSVTEEVYKYDNDSGDESSNVANSSDNSESLSIESSMTSITEVDATEKDTDLWSNKDFLWTYQEEPHRTRRIQILKAHPEVTKLCGHEPFTKYIVTGVVLLQFTMAYLLRNTPVLSWKFLLVAYVIGATANQNVFLCIHELSHNLGFKKPMHNRLFAIFANLPIGIPYSASFRPYHLIHHKHLGDTNFDTDLPTKLEAIVLRNVAGKAFFATFQIFFYAVRPMFVMKLPFTSLHLLNVLIQIAVDVVLVKSIGVNALLYFIMSSFLAGSLHPCAGHFIAEHYVFDPPKNMSPNILPPETYSYYGILNIFTYNVGLHNEHHDFPFIPWSRLPTLSQIASEFYAPLPKHESWTKVLINFIFDDNLSLWSRVKRESRQQNIVEKPVIKDSENGSFDDDEKKSL
ncbi:fatty acid desaturase-domain-containing protein [Dipodascopsis uninucleata]